MQRTRKSMQRSGGHQRVQSVCDEQTEQILSAEQRLRRSTPVYTASTS